MRTVSSSPFLLSSASGLLLISPHPPRAAYRLMMLLLGFGSMFFFVSMADDSQCDIDHAQDHKHKSLYYRYQGSHHVKGNRYHKFRQSSERTNDLVVSHDVPKQTQRERDRSKCVREQLQD